MHTPRLRLPLLAATAVALVVASGCGTDSGSSTETTTTAPPNTTAAPAQLGWESYHGVQIPRSPVDGPKYSLSPVSTGYSKTPQGAVLAAVRGQAELALAGDNEWGKIVATITAPGPGRTDYTTARAVVTIDGTVPTDKAAKFVAFKITAYRIDAATLTAAVQVVMSVGEPAQLWAQPVALQWISDDWRIVLPTQAESADPIELTSLDGYTPLGGA